MSTLRKFVLDRWGKVVVAIVAIIAVVYGICLPHLLYSVSIKFSCGPDAKFMVRILDANGDAIIKFCNGTTLHVKLDPRKYLEYIPKPLIVGKIVQIYDGVKSINANFVIRKAGIIEKISLRYVLVREVRDYGHSRIVKVFELSNESYRRLVNVLESVYHNESIVRYIISKLPYTITVSIGLVHARAYRVSSAISKTYNFTIVGRDIAGFVIVTVTHIISLTYDGSKVVTNGGAITCAGISGYWFYSEIKIDGKTVASGYSAISASKKVDEPQSTIELLTSIYFGINIGGTHIGCQIGSVYTKAINYGDGWSHYYMQYNAPGNTGTDAGWVDP